MTGILDLIQKSTDSENIKLLNLLSLAREYFWSTVLKNPIFENIQIKIHNVVCEKCQKIISDESECSCIKETVILTAGRGRKQCKNTKCLNFVGPRTIICSYCGFNFKTGLLESSFKKKEPIVKVSKNKKKKKGVFVSLSQIKTLNILIENDKIEENILLFRKGTENYELLNEDQKSTVDSYFEWRNKIWRDNLPLFKGMANLIYQSMLRKDSIRHLKSDDLHQAACIGGIKAITHYDVTRTDSRTGEERSIAFSTYAHPWIRKEIYKEILEKDKEIFVPIHVINEFKKFKKFYDEYIKENNFEPSIEKIMKNCKVTEKVATGLLILKDIRQYKISSIEVTMDKYKNDTSEEYTINKNDVDLVSKLSNEEEYNFDYLKYLEYCNWTKPEYKNMFLDYFGFNDERIALTSDQLEKKYDVSSQTINNQIKKTLEHLKGLIEE